MERDALEENEFHHADVLFDAELTGHPSHGLQQLHRVQRGLIESRTRSVGRWRSDATCKGGVSLAIDLGSAPESVPRLSGYLVCAAPPMQAGAPVSSAGDSAARRRAEAFENGFEIEPRLWSELNGLAQSNSSVARGYAL
jgi:LDH2 family malate/lactate/ureidoglycolate dehydrogenase